MTLRFVALCTLGVLLTACRADPLGKPCKQDDECGPGFDCYPDVCVQVCTTDDECRAGTCFQFHCVQPGTENVVPKFGANSGNQNTTKAPTRKAAPYGQTPPPVPNATVAELRAIRRELELIRQSHRQILKALEAKGIELPEPVIHPETPVIPQK